VSLASDPPSSASKVRAGKPLKPLAWTLSTYFAEGVPFMVVRSMSTAFFTDLLVKERYLGYLNFLALPWNLKFLWSPLIDMSGTKKRWLCAMQTLIAVLSAVIAALCAAMALHPAAGHRLLVWVSLLFVAMAFLAATNDIAIDAFYLAGLPDRKAQTAFSGYRIFAYRIAIIYVRAGLIWLVAFVASHFAGGSLHVAWACGFAAAALTMAALALFHARRLPVVESNAHTSGRDVLRTYTQAFVSYLQQPRIAIVLAFITTYKLGDEILFSMVTPFLMRYLGVTKAQLGWISGFVGAAGAILGAMAGSWWIKRQGLKRAIWPITLFMNLNILVYIWMAHARPLPTTTTGLVIIAVIHGYEQFASGIGSLALMVFMLGTCKAEFKAAHFAIGSAFMTVFATFFGGFGGRIVEAHGYVSLFILAFLCSIPAMLLLLVVPFSGPTGAAPTGGEKK
jgi:MFS transporter, PAT family, beta-lactamase induction signal transducer AmpG